MPCDLIWVQSAHFLHGLLQVIYSRNGVNVTSTPVQHYTTAGPVALRLDYAGLSVTYSGALLPQCLVIVQVAALHRDPFFLRDNS